LAAAVNDETARQREHKDELELEEVASARRERADWCGEPDV
jgi:hypothetical protein